MNRKGQSIPLWAIIMATIALIVIGVVLGGLGKIFDTKINPIANLIPGGGGINSSNGGLNVVGFELSNSESAFLNSKYSLQSASVLLYYTGTDWKVYDSKKKVRVGSNEFDVEKVRGDIADFYYYTSRKGKDSFAYNNIPDNLKVQTYNDVAAGQTSLFDSKGYLNLVIIDSGKSISLAFNDAVVGDKSKLRPDDFRSILTYRDQVLSGQSCEKFLSIGSKNYRVRKEILGEIVYLFVDLNNPANGEQKYDKC